MNTYQLTNEEYNELMEASKPTRYMVFNGSVSMSPQERSVAVWKEVAIRVGCDWTTIQPGATDREFVALPSAGFHPAAQQERNESAN